MSVPASANRKIANVVSGFVRENYDGSVPEAIVKLILLFFNQNIIISWRGKRLQRLLSLPAGKPYRYTFKFNRDLSFFLFIGPNGGRVERPGFFELGLKICSMSDNIDYIIICWEQSCCDYKTESSLIAQNYKEVFKFDQINKSSGGLAHIGKLYQFKNAKQLSMQFIIHSLKIKYRATNTIHYYPSFKAHQLKPISVLKWNVDKLLIKKFKKDWPNTVPFHSPIFDSLCICCYPNLIGKFRFSITSTLFPENVSKIKVLFIVKCNLDDKEKKYRKEFQDNPTLHKRGIISMPCTQNVFSANKLKDELTFHVKMIIMKLYDFNDNKIPNDKWRDHNVVLND